MVKNPHNYLLALDPRGTPNRCWRGVYCDLEGAFEEVEAVACAHVYPPCTDCGLTPTCAPDCKGAWSALAALQGTVN
jgi:hypothetical protein